MTNPVFDVTGAVAVLNQTLEYSFPSITVVGELASLKISKGKWLYFDLKDSESKIKCFGLIFTQAMPVVEGMMVEIIAKPRLHSLYGFSLNITSIRPVGEGSIKKASNILKEKLRKEGLFEVSRKRSIPYPPSSIALIASSESAGYEDFLKIVNNRWPYLTINHYEVTVQGVDSEEEVIGAIYQANQHAEAPEVIVIIRGGGSADDLSIFSRESVARAVASSRIPTLVAIGHETDESLAELVADLSASTPSNAAELLVPEVSNERLNLSQYKKYIKRSTEDAIGIYQAQLKQDQKNLFQKVDYFFERVQTEMDRSRTILNSYHPDQVLKRGYGLVRINGKLIRSNFEIPPGTEVDIELESMNLQTKLISAIKK